MAGQSHTHTLLEYNASLMSQKGRSLEKHLSPFFGPISLQWKKESKAEWMMDGAVTTTTSDAQLTKEFSSEGKKAFFDSLWTCWTWGKNVVTGTLGIDSFSLCLIESTHMHRPSSGVGLLMPFLHILNVRHIAIASYSFRAERVRSVWSESWGRKWSISVPYQNTNVFFVKLSNSK